MRLLPRDLSTILLAPHRVIKVVGFKACCRVQCTILHSSVVCPVRRSIIQSSSAFVPSFFFLPLPPLSLVQPHHYHYPHLPFPRASLSSGDHSPLRDSPAYEIERRSVGEAGTVYDGDIEDVPLGTFPRDYSFIHQTRPSFPYCFVCRHSQ